MGDLLDLARAVTPRPTSTLKLSEFAQSGRLIRLTVPGLEAPDRDTLVVLAADNADTRAVPPDVVIFWPDEIAAMYQAGGIDRLLWKTKRHFDPHGRTEAENDPCPSVTPSHAPCTLSRSCSERKRPFSPLLSLSAGSAKSPPRTPPADPDKLRIHGSSGAITCPVMSVCISCAVAASRSSSTRPRWNVGHWSPPGSCSPPAA